MHQNQPQLPTTCNKKCFSAPPNNQQGGMILSFVLLIAFIVGLVFLALYIVKQNELIVSKFEGKQWNLPTTVYSQPLELTADIKLSETELLNWLKLSNYKNSHSTQSTGTYSNKNGEYIIHTRPFTFSENRSLTQQKLKIKISDNQIVSIQSNQPNQQKVYLEPIEIGKIYPDNNEDRTVIELKNVPQPLIDALIATEDRAFYEHHGISIRGTARAFYSNMTGGSRQGGSTITQQLVKNYFLNSDKTIKRKANEALMALILEYHYDKDKILQTYINEINLGQNGNYSVNGFDLASKFYFARPLNELRLDQLAFLVGLAKGPTQYNPFRNVKMALERRNVVLHNMLVMGKIDQKTYENAIKQPLDVVENVSVSKKSKQYRFADYLDIVKRELNKTYYAEDLKNEGLKVFTSFQPLAQLSAEKAINNSLQKFNIENLQSALVSANPTNGELLAVVGSSNQFTGFNRAVDAKRQVGSLLKPIIYLTAFEEGKYNLASGVQDNLDGIKGLGSWSPNNYSGRSYGMVPLITALANSYNLSAVRVGMEVGVPKFLNQLYRMGITTKLPEYPSTLLGAVDLSPMDMLGIYQVLANGGIKYELHTIRSVVQNDGKVLPHEITKPQQVISPSATYLTNVGMQQVIKTGTAKSASSFFGENLKLAGKTGTTNDARDSWFAGYSGNYVTVVWLGLDNNKAIGLTGGSGALPVWTNYMRQLHLSPVNLPKPDNIEWTWLENGTGYLTEQGCYNTVHLPINTNYRPPITNNCGNQSSDDENLATDTPTDDETLSDNSETDVEPTTNETTEPTEPTQDNSELVDEIVDDPDMVETVN